MPTNVNLDKVIRYRIKSVYGNDLIYPLDYVNEILMLTKKKTIDSMDMKALITMGFSFERVL